MNDDSRNVYLSNPKPEAVRFNLETRPNLERLTIHWDSRRVIDPAPHETLDEIVSIVAAHGKNLKSLSISSSYLLDQHLRHLNQESLPFLRHLDLSRCSLLGAQGVKHAVSQLPEITYLNLNYSLYYQLDSDAAAQYIGQYLPNLQTLAMYRDLTVLDTGIAAIAQGCPQLEYLDIGRNPGLTDEALRKLGEHCHKLRYLNVYNNPLITEKGLINIIAGCPDFTCFHCIGIQGIKEVEEKYPQICFGGVYCKGDGSGKKEEHALPQEMTIINDSHLSPPSKDTLDSTPKSIALPQEEITIENTNENIKTQKNCVKKYPDTEEERELNNWLYTFEILDSSDYIYSAKPLHEGITKIDYEYKNWDYYGRYMNELPESIWALCNLTELKLKVDDCGFSHIPESIGQLINLERLDLSHNSLLTELPESIGQLSNLRELDLNATPIESLPSWLIQQEERGLLVITR